MIALLCGFLLLALAVFSENDAHQLAALVGGALLVALGFWSALFSG